MKKPPIYRIYEIVKKDGLVVLFYKIAIYVVIQFTPLTMKIRYFFIKHIFKSTIKEILGLKMLLNLKDDEGLTKQLFLRGKREIFLTDYFINSNLLSKGDIQLDIGANRGYYALISSKIVGDSGKIYAIEPVKRNIEYLKKNIELNSCDNIDIYNLAVGSKNRMTDMYVRREYNKSSMTIIPGNNDIISKETIEESTVDSFLEDKDIPNLIRMDVEGYELEVIKGMKNSLKYDLKILMEIHPHLMDEKQVRELFTILSENNFTLEKAIFDPPEELLDSNAKINHFVISLKKKIGEFEKYGFLYMDMDEMIEWLYIKKECPHLLFVKRK